jgi:TRAP-type uncharacterized transport system fused permease subunit
LIVFWFCEIGGVTPPVCILAFITAAIAKCKPYESAWYGIRLASPLFVIAFLIAYTPITLNGPTADVIETVVSCTIGLIAYAGFVQGCWARVTVLWERAFLGIGALCLFHPNISITFWQIKMPKEATV